MGQYLVLVPFIFVPLMNVDLLEECCKETEVEGNDA